MPPQRFGERTANEIRFQRRLLEEEGQANVPRYADLARDHMAEDRRIAARSNDAEHHQRVVFVVLVLHLCEGCADHLDLLRMGDESNCVERVDPRLEQDASAGNVGIVFPPDASRLDPLFEPETTELAVIIRPGSERADEWIEAKGLGDHEGGLRPPKGVRNAVRFVDRASDRLFEEKRLLRFDHTQRHLEVRPCWNGGDDRIHVGALDQLIERRCESHPDVGRYPSSPGRVTGPERTQGRSGDIAGREVSRISDPVAARSDEAEPQNGVPPGDMQPKMATSAVPLNPKSALCSGS